MDYKTNPIREYLDCNEELMYDFPYMHYGKVEKDMYVFDSTRFCKEANVDEVDHKIFQRLNKRYIESLIKHSNLDPNKLFYVNTDGHMLINHELTFLFMAFAVPELVSYFNGLIGELITNGVAYSDGFVFALVNQRCSDDMLRDVLNSRENEST